VGQVQHNENRKSKQSNYLLNRKNGMQTVAMVMPKDLKKWSDGISVIPNTDLISTLAIHSHLATLVAKSEEN
jgi:hypothetical protein